jgi:hypothetical protein
VKREVLLSECLCVGWLVRALLQWDFVVDRALQKILCNFLPLNQEKKFVLVGDLFIPRVFFFFEQQTSAMKKKKRTCGA